MVNPRDMAAITLSEYRTIYTTIYKGKFKGTYLNNFFKKLLK